MRLRVMLSVVVCLGVVAAMTARVASQDTSKEAQPGEEMMQAWMKYAEPGEYHAHLAPLVGRWTQNVKWWMVPGVPPEASKGTSEYKWIHGKRFLLQTVKGETEGGVFEGLGMIGYDNFKKKYTSMWSDNMTTAIVTSLGTCDDSGKVITMIGKQDDLVTGKPNQPFRSVIRIINKDKHVDEMYMTGPDGKEFKTLEIVYTRS